MENKVEVDFKEFRDYKIDTDWLHNEVGAWYNCYVQFKGELGECHTKFNHHLDACYLDSTHTFTRNSVKELAYRISWEISKSKAITVFGEEDNNITNV